MWASYLQRLRLFCFPNYKSMGAIDPQCAAGLDSRALIGRILCRGRLGIATRYILAVDGGPHGLRKDVLSFPIILIYWR